MNHSTKLITSFSKGLKCNMRVAYKFIKIIKSAILCSLYCFMAGQRLLSHRQLFVVFQLVLSVGFKISSTMSKYILQYIFNSNRTQIFVAILTFGKFVIFNWPICFRTEENELEGNRSTIEYVIVLLSNLSTHYTFSLFFLCISSVFRCIYTFRITFRLLLVLALWSI